MPRISVSKNDMQDKSYTVSGNRSFIYRYADTGFRTKWCGIWMPPYKFFEYFAFKVNGAWLSPANTEEFSLEKGTAVHTFVPGGIAAEEIVFAPLKMPAIIVQLKLKNNESAKKTVFIELEAAVNMRPKNENFHARTYETDFQKAKNAVVVCSEGRCAAFGAGKVDKKISVEFVKTEAYKDHYPGGELERCFIPGSYIVKFELDANETFVLPFIFAGSLSGKKELLRNYEVCFHDAKHSHILRHSAHNHASAEISTPDKEINEAYLWSAADVFSLMHEGAPGKGFFAGYPWFLEFWGRDTFWSIKGLVDLGEFEKAKEILMTMARFQKERMPCVLHLDGSAEYYGADVDALFLLALDYYISQSRDAAAEKEFGKNTGASVSSLVLENGLAKHRENETWADSLKREGTAVEIQSLWIEALKKRSRKTAFEMIDKLNDAFWNEDAGYLNDSAGSAKGARKTANALVPLMFGQVPQRHANIALETAQRELMGPYGMATLSRNDAGYGPSKYHEGATWGLTTAIGACAFLRQGKPNHALACLRAMASDLKRHTLGGMSECLNSETGELIGCGMQLWSAALFIHATDRYLFGISGDAGKIIIEPKMPLSWNFMERKNKKIGKEIFDISIIRAKGGYEFDIRFRNPLQKTRVEIAIPENIRSAHVNNKPLKANTCQPGAAGLREMSEIKETVLGKFHDCLKNSVEFEAEKSNTVVIRTI